MIIIFWVNSLVLWTNAVVPNMEYTDEAATFCLSEEEAFSFIEDVLAVRNARQKLECDRLAFLDSLIHSMYQTIPFQSLYRCSIPAKERHRPPFSIIKQNMMKKYGGTCETIQPFFKCLLDALGFKTDLFPGSILGNVDGHTGIVVHNLEFHGSKHMVEVGCACPVLTAIPLNFEKESQMYSHSFLTHKYLRRADGILEWLHRFKDVDSGWFKFAELNISRLVDISYFFVKNEADYTDPTNKFNCGVWAVRMNGNRFFAVKGSTIKWSEEQDQQLLSQNIGSKEELKAILHKNFPQFPLRMIEQALSNTRQSISPS